MPIIGLTDRNTIRPRLARLGKLRKGSEKINNSYGKDLDHFRPDLNDPEAQQAFVDAYGDKPRTINVLLFYDTLEDNFSTWIEDWDASGLVFRSDGENWVVWREGNEYKRGSKPHVTSKTQGEVGRFEFLIPELLQAGFRGTVTLETHSNHDLRHIASVLLAAEQERGTLRGAQFVMRRVQEEISVPGWGDRAGKRSTAKKWLVKLEPPRGMFEALLEAPEHPALPAGDVDEVTGEILDPDVIDQAVEEDFPDDGTTPEQRKAMDFTMPSGKRLGEMTLEELDKIAKWCKDNPENTQAIATLPKVEIVQAYLVAFMTANQPPTPSDNIDIPF